MMRVIMEVIHVYLKKVFTRESKFSALKDVEINGNCLQDIQVNIIEVKKIMKNLMEQKHNGHMVFQIGY